MLHFSLARSLFSFCELKSDFNGADWIGLVIDFVRFLHLIKAFFAFFLCFIDLIVSVFFLGCARVRFL